MMSHRGDFKKKYDVWRKARWVGETTVARRREMSHGIVDISGWCKVDRRDGIKSERDCR